VKRHLVAESALLSELELILCKVFRQNITEVDSAGRQSGGAARSEPDLCTNLKTFLLSMKTATLRLFSLKKFTTPLIMMDYFLFVSRFKSYVGLLRVEKSMRKTKITVLGFWFCQDY
jgi:hypothetical protein